MFLERFDPDQLEEVVDGTCTRHRLLPGGLLRIRHERLTLGSGTLNRGRYDMGILADGSFPSGQVSVGVVLAGSSPIAINGFTGPLHSIQLYSEGCDFCYRAAPGTTWFIYTVERERIQRAALRLYDRTLPFPQTGTMSFEPDAEGGRQLARTIENLFAASALAAPLARETAPIAFLEEQLHYNLAHALYDREGADPCREFRVVKQRCQIVDRAEEYLRASLHDSFSLTKFADAVGASPRMLEYYFRRIYGMTPNAWFRTMKLNAVRDELQKSSSMGTRVSDIAMHWGFQHLGRFSVQYGKLFDEHPKDTLRR